MKLSRILLVAGLAFGLSFSATSASAATVDYTGNFVDMTPSPLAVGQSGEITSTGSFGDLVLSLVTGSLPANSMVTFTYNFAGTLASGLLTTSAGYSYVDGGTSYNGYTTASSPAFTYSVGYENAAPATALAVSSAQISGDNSATLIIKNLSAGVLTYANSFMGTVLGAKNFTVAYNVSAVPVPAALPLFGLGLGALAAMRMRARKKQNLAA